MVPSARPRRGLRVTDRRAPRGARFLFYTNECVGLGHLRRTLNLAKAVTDLDHEASALVITGSSAALGEQLHERIDLIKLPELSRDCDGDLHAARLGMDTGHLHELRAHLAFAAAEAFAPSVVIVDRTPLGLNDELVPTLEALQATRTKIVLGLRDIDDAPRRGPRQVGSRRPARVHQSALRQHPGVRARILDRRARMHGVDRPGRPRPPRRVRRVADAQKRT